MTSLKAALSFLSTPFPFSVLHMSISSSSCRLSQGQEEFVGNIHEERSCTSKILLWPGSHQSADRQSRQASSLQGGRFLVPGCAAHDVSLNVPCHACEDHVGSKSMQRIRTVDSGSGIPTTNDRNGEISGMFDERVSDGLLEVVENKTASSDTTPNRSKLSSRRIMSAALETSVPMIPIATPISAFFKAGASLTPSPVTATPLSSGLFDDIELLRRRRAGENDLRMGHVESSLARIGTELVAGDDNRRG